MAAFRNRFSARDQDHPFLAQDEPTFLESLGVIRRDRQRQCEGLTLAGLLMFGKERSLLDALPHYHLDYQEQLSTDLDTRWTYRLTVDGKWAPNLFNFYYRVFPRLTDGLNTPFRTDRHATRMAETHVHEALREALVNTLVHADHQSTLPIHIVRRKDAFVFSNPGLLRIPRDQLYQGGASDARNPTLLKLFQLLGLGERAGSGFQKIVRAWREQNWLVPLVTENLALETTLVNLPLASMIAADVEHELRALVGSGYPSLDELSRLILIMAHRFGEVRNQDVQPHCRAHARDIGDRLGQLATSGWLIKEGQGRGTRYCWPLKAPADLLTGLPEAPPAEVTAEVKLLLRVLTGDMSRAQLQASLKLAHEEHFRKAYLQPAIQSGMVEMTLPDKPRSRLQRYRLTMAGLKMQSSL